MSEAAGLAAPLQRELDVVARSPRRVEAADGARIHAPRVLRRRGPHRKGYGRARSAAPVPHVARSVSAVVQRHPVVAVERSGWVLADCLFRIRWLGPSRPGYDGAALVQAVDARHVRLRKPVGLLTS